MISESWGNDTGWKCSIATSLISGNWRLQSINLSPTSTLRYGLSRSLEKASLVAGWVRRCPEQHMVVVVVVVVFPAPAVLIVLVPGDSGGIAEHIVRMSGPT